MKWADCLFYQGQSMAGTFKTADCLKIEKTSIAALNPGDTIVFRLKKETEGKDLVHRIVLKTNERIITRGDNNPRNDEEPVTEENLIGKVTHYERNGKIRKVWNGRLGMMRARVLHGRLYIIRTAKFFLRKPYRMIKRSGIVAKLWRPEIETIHFETQDGPLVKYVHVGRTVASCWLDSNRWWFRRPYDFVIDPKAKLKG
jgi:signal peptidase I